MALYRVLGISALLAVVVVVGTAVFTYYEDRVPTTSYQTVERPREVVNPTVPAVVQVPQPTAHDNQIAKGISPQRVKELQRLVAAYNEDLELIRIDRKVAIANRSLAATENDRGEVDRQQHIIDICNIRVTETAELRNAAIHELRSNGYNAVE